MDEILNQLGGLVLGSVPTMILFILLVIAYGLLVRRPLDRILSERRARTSGAMEQARGAIANAEASTSVYEEKLRVARSEIYAAREAKLKQWNAERETAVGTVREESQKRVLQAKVDIEQAANAARGQIDAVSEDLSVRVLSAVLPANIAAAEAGR
jgi:F-type H+-transporting ATPase subunit b